MVIFMYVKVVPENYRSEPTKKEQDSTDKSLQDAKGNHFNKEL